MWLISFKKCSTWIKKAITYGKTRLNYKVIIIYKKCES